MKAPGAPKTVLQPDDAKPVTYSAIARDDVNPGDSIP
jgi:hypothetical protein